MRKKIRFFSVLSFPQKKVKKLSPVSAASASLSPSPLFLSLFLSLSCQMSLSPLLFPQNISKKERGLLSLLKIKKHKKEQNTFSFLEEDPAAAQHVPADVRRRRQQHQQREADGDRRGELPPLRGLGHAVSRRVLRVALANQNIKTER